MAEFRNDEEEEMATKVSKPKINSTVLGKTKNDADGVLSVKKQKLEEISGSGSLHTVGEDEEEDDEEFDLNGNDDDDSEENEGEDEDSNGKVRKEVVDHKGKGKLVEESESSSDSDSDSDSGDAEYGSDSDLSEDPLDEVDLDNILPSRTRRHVPQRGIQIGNNVDSENRDAKN